ncbi:patched domain-containing protein 3-like [Centruroides vittatus]|uniref:patched domain-containing protein 3-like n=1 Tax=Centruroides vittatus TaxID=120091 RepID=UPI0035105608
MKHDYVKRLLSFVFSRIGYHIGCHPLWYLFVPFLITTLLATGFYKITLVNDIEYLYSPINARGRTERHTLETLFPPNISQDFDFFRISKAGRLGSVIVVPKKDSSMLNELIIGDLIRLDHMIQNISIFWNNSSFTYKELCCKTIKNECYENFVLSFKGKTEEIKAGKFAIRYPFDKNNGDPITSAMILGGVLVNEANNIIDFKAVRLLYMLDYSTKVKNKMASKWEETFLESLSNVQFETIEIYKFIGKSFDYEVNTISKMVLPLLFIAAPLILIFAAVSCLTFDVVTSKPWLGIMGCLSPVVSTVAAFGLLLHCNAEYVDLNLGILFLMLGVGIDDSFVLLASWRRTSRKDDVKHRMSEAYSEAAVSITVTSLTNFLSFCIGLTTPYRVIQIFSLYSAVSVLFDFFFQIFFFGSFMALEGFREEKQLHSVLCLRVKSVKAAELSENTRTDDTFMMKIFRDILGTFLQHNFIKFLVIVVFVLYLSLGIYCTKWIKEGFDYVNILPTSSYLLKYMVAHYEYFTDYPQKYT